ncbi:unnamed protein product, partial [Larinioides sclopetarius]
MITRLSYDDRTVRNGHVFSRKFQYKIFRLSPFPNKHRKE